MLIDMSVFLNTGRPFFLFLQTVCFQRMEREVSFSLGMLPDEVFLAISGCYHRNTQGFAFPEMDSAQNTSLVF